MKKILSLILVLAFTVTLFSCSKKAEVLAEYTVEGQKPIHAAKLYSDPRREEYAILIREADQMKSSVAVGTLGGETKTVYTAPDECYIHELVAGAGTVAFYELYPMSDGSTLYKLKAVNTETGEVYSPYTKLLSLENDMQPRFLTVYNNCVYYLTKALQLESCRIMKFDMSDSSLSEFVTTDMTENSFTYGHSCTFFNRRGDDLIVSRVDGYTQYIDIYSLSSGKRSSEKKLPSSVGVVYNCDYDPSSGVYAIYYCQLTEEGLGADCVGTTSKNSDELKIIFTAAEGNYLSNEALRIENNIVLFNISANSDTFKYENFNGVLCNMASESVTRFTGSVYTWYDSDAIYNISLDEELHTDKIILTRREIVAE